MKSRRFPDSRAWACRAAVIAAGLCAAIVLCPGAAGAEEPCPCPAAPKAPPLFSGEAGISYLGTSGNTSTATLGGNLSFAWKPDPWKVEMKLGYLRAETDSIVTAEAFSGSLTGSRALTERLDVYAGGAYYKNVFSGISHRTNGNAGAGFKIFTGPPAELRAELGAGYETIQRTESVGTDSYAIGHAGLNFLWKFSKGAEFSAEASYNDNLDQTDDWVFRSKASVSAALVSIFSLKVGWGLEYNNVPTPGFKKTDTITSVALVAKF